MSGPVDIDRDTDGEVVRSLVTEWVTEHVPAPWREAAAQGRAAIRTVRSRDDYEQWYPTFADSGLVVAMWPRDYGGLDLTRSQAVVVEDVLAPFNLGRLNPLGLNLVAPALFACGTDGQRRRFLPPLARNEERWCQLFSEPGAGSDLAGLATTAVRDGDEWRLTGQKVWTTWAHRSEFGICLARTDPTVPKRRGITYFLIDLRQPGVEVQPLRHMGGAVDFNAVFLDDVRVPDSQRVGGIGEGWTVANATLSGERQMVSGSSSGGVDRIGGSGVERLIRAAQESGRWSDPMIRQQLMRLLSEERIRGWTNRRVRALVKAGGTPGPAASIGKVHQGELNQRIQLLACDLLGPAAQAWVDDEADRTDYADATNYAGALPYEVAGMLRSRANTIEGGTTEVNKNIIGERVLGLPREPDPYNAVAWREVPRS